MNNKTQKNKRNYTTQQTTTIKKDCHTVYCVMLASTIQFSHNTPTNQQTTKQTLTLPIETGWVTPGDNAPDTQQCTNEPHNYFRPLTFHTMFCVFIVWCVSTRLKTLLAAPPTGTQPTTKKIVSQNKVCQNNAFGIPTTVGLNKAP